MNALDYFKGFNINDKKNQIQNKSNEPSDKRKVKKSNIIDITDKEKFIKQQDDLAIKNGFIPYASSECYGRQLSKSTEVFLQRQSNGFWLVWRGTWVDGNSKPKSERILVDNIDFNSALTRAVSYVEWFEKKNR